MAESETAPIAAKEDHEAKIADARKAAWQSPRITSYLPVSDSEGISFRPLDGITNLS